MTIVDSIITVTFKCTRCGHLYETAIRESQLEDNEGWIILCPKCDEVVPAKLVDRKIKTKSIKEKIMFT